ncbi:helix-turn-helix domain containing protein [Microbacterium sp. STN6]|uniref:TetR/AcrR family transcriptional regulator n=1 Tax=Microbacterium sp. STN6 TaxID=2995588 RepID=UPI002260D51A|nr:TetR/AcrR family transcriptional regulator [Microbacterium sp. STN6]MCX7523368.1 helix-turn-helix domain containing protein [Microbacterium sp. STN6]
MAEKNAKRGDDSRQRWIAQIAALENPPTPARSRKAPLTVERIVHTALELIEAEGFEAVTMRRVAAALQTGAASLYAHVRNKAALDDLLIGELCSHVMLPEPDPKQWQAQIMNVCGQLRDQFLRYPGIATAAMAATPTSLETLRINEGLLTLLLAGGAPPQFAAWAIDAAYLYVAAYSLEASLRSRPGNGEEGGDHDNEHEHDNDNDEIVERLRMLPTSLFPNTVAHARELSTGDGHERFDFTLGQLFRLPSSAE